ISEWGGTEEAHGPRAVRLQHYALSGLFSRTGSRHALAHPTGYFSRQSEGLPGDWRWACLSGNPIASLPRLPAGGANFDLNFLSLCESRLRGRAELIGLAVSAGRRPHRE